MKYVLLIYEAPDQFEARSGQDQGAYWGAWKAYADAIGAAGIMAGGNCLEPPSSSTTVRLKNGERAVQDGPFADTKEQLGGLFVVDVPDLDTALEWAARCPTRNGSVEVRPTLSGNSATPPA